MGQEIHLIRESFFSMAELKGFKVFPSGAVIGNGGASSSSEATVAEGVNHGNCLGATSFSEGTNHGNGPGASSFSEGTNDGNCPGASSFCDGTNHGNGPGASSFSEVMVEEL